jgi:hypothetical protein
MEKCHAYDDEIEQDDEESRRAGDDDDERRGEGGGDNDLMTRGEAQTHTTYTYTHIR